MVTILGYQKFKKNSILLTEGDITGPGDGIPPEDIPGDIGFPGPTPAPT